MKPNRNKKYRSVVINKLVSTSFFGVVIKMPSVLTTPGICLIFTFSILKVIEYYLPNRLVLLRHFPPIKGVNEGFLFLVG